MQKDFKEITPFPLNGLQEMLLLSTQSGRIIYTSGALKLFLDEDLTGRNLNDITEDKAAARLIAETQAGNPYAFSCTACGHRFEAEAVLVEEMIRISMKPLDRRDGAFMTVSASQFLAKEININVATVLPAVEEMEKTLKGSARNSAAVIRRNAYRLLRLSRNLQDCAELENGELRLHYSKKNLADVCRKLSERLKEVCGEMNVRFICELPEEPVSCHIDVERVKKALLNLVANAVASLPSENGMVELRLVAREREAEIVVRDNGCGIENGRMGTIFRQYGEDLLHTYGGVGFGLALVKGVAELHGGYITILSDCKSGTAVHMFLPYNLDKAQDSLGAFAPSYGIGMDEVEVELSSVLPPRHFRKD